MGNLERFLEESSIAGRVVLPATIVLRRLTLSPEEAGSVAESGVFSPKGGAVCELEVGGQCLARGRIRRRGGRAYFKVLEIGGGGER